MKELLFVVCFCLVISFNAPAQSGVEEYYSFDALSSDYKQVSLVAHVKVKSVKFAAPDIHPLYLLQSEVIEPLKGKLWRGQTLEFYASAEEGYDPNLFLGESIVFLEGSANSPTGRWSWFMLENSSRRPSAETLALMRKVKRLSQQRRKSKNGQAAARSR